MNGTMTVIPIQLGWGVSIGHIGRVPPSGDSRRIITGRSGFREASREQADLDMNAQTKPSRSEDYGDLPDERLLEIYREGDREAFTHLMGRYSNELLHFLTRFLGSRAAGEDVFQETFLQIHLVCESFDATRRFKPWLFTIAANKARDYHRKHSKRKMLSLSTEIGGSGEGDRFVDLLEAELPTPSAPMLDAERSMLVKAVVDEMSVLLREILLLSYFQRLSYRQIAEALDIPLGTVKSRLHAAVAAFAVLWREKYEASESDDQTQAERAR